MQKRWIGLLWCALALLSAGSLAQAQTVKVIPLGSHPGEFCRAERAIMFEDPTGVRILYDAGQTIVGGSEWITENGKVRAGTRTKELMDLVKDRPVYIPISDKTMEFDGQAKCVAGCS